MVASRGRASSAPRRVSTAAAVKNAEFISGSGSRRSLSPSRGGRYPLSPESNNLPQRQQQQQQPQQQQPSPPRPTRRSNTSSWSDVAEVARLSSFRVDSAYSAAKCLLSSLKTDSGDGGLDDSNLSSIK
jgi:hypothetical protein